MKASVQTILKETILRYPCLANIEKSMQDAFNDMCDSFQNEGRLYLCGNGGSAADCEHIVGELMKSFKIPSGISESEKNQYEIYGAEGKFIAENFENGLPTVSLCGHPSFRTAFANDKNPLMIFAQQVRVYGRAGDVLFVISTSGNSLNCVYATIAAKVKKMKVILLSGGNGGRLKELADISIIVPESETYKVQELHLPVYHCLCAMLEEDFYGCDKNNF